MHVIRALAIFALLPFGTAVAQMPPGDAKFCQQYATTVATAADDAIRMNPACRNPGKGVHSDQKMHVDWCRRTPSDDVEGASVHIRRLASQCTNNGLVEPTEYGGYDIIGAAQFERPYGTAQQWTIFAAFSGQLFMYCVAVGNVEGRSVRIGVDQAMPGDGRQWQLAVPVRASKDWQGRLEIDGAEPANRAGAEVSGSAFADWTIAWLNMGQLEALHQGTTAILGVGKRDYDFSLAGLAAAITKVEECRTREGATTAAPASSARSPDSHPFTVVVSTSPKARALLAAKKERVKIAAMYSGDPVKGKDKMANEIGEIDLGAEDVYLPQDGGTAALQGKVAAAKWSAVSTPGVLLNVVSSGVDANHDNLLECSLFQDSFAVAQRQPIPIFCKLIGE